MKHSPASASLAQTKHRSVHSAKCATREGGVQRTADAFEASAQLCLLDAPGAVVALLAVLECKANCSERADHAQSRRHRFGHAEREQFAACRHGSACLNSPTCVGSWWWRGTH